MSILEQIDSELITAMKAKDEMKTSLFRGVKAAIKNKEIETQKPLDDNGILEVLAKEAKKRKESAIAFEQGGRADLADKEKAELAIIEKFLPAQLGEDEIRKVTQETITAMSATLADMGKVIGAVVSKLKGQADGSIVSKIVKEELNK